VKIYSRNGDDGTTGLLFGGRVAKSSEPIEVNGAVDEAQAALGWARAVAGAGHELASLTIRLERDLWVLMAEVATLPENRDKLTPNATRVTHEMVEALETDIDLLSSQIEMPREFVVPGENQISAAFDVARTVVRRAERIATQYPLADSYVVPYLNRLSDLVWTMARWAEGSAHRVTRSV
jgi:cob(I)alamin adenosyltransferase